MKETVAVSQASNNYAPSELEQLRTDAAHLSDYLRTALIMLATSNSPFLFGTKADRDWQAEKDEFVEAVRFEYFNGPQPGKAHPY
jgi:hypothetical protein